MFVFNERLILINLKKWLCTIGCNLNQRLFRNSFGRCSIIKLPVPVKCIISATFFLKTQTKHNYLMNSHLHMRVLTHTRTHARTRARTHAHMYAYIYVPGLTAAQEVAVNSK